MRQFLHTLSTTFTPIQKGDNGAAAAACSLRNTGYIMPRSALDFFLRRLYIQMIFFFEDLNDLLACTSASARFSLFLKSDYQETLLCHLPFLSGEQCGGDSVLVKG